jgi:hypothetical protein
VDLVAFAETKTFLLAETAYAIVLSDRRRLLHPTVLRFRDTLSLFIYLVIKYLESEINNERKRESSRICRKRPPMEFASLSART